VTCVVKVTAERQETIWRKPGQQWALAFADCHIESGSCGWSGLL
jgi:hypothetical protein